MKRLKRQVQKEKRGAMRELRKDATFIDAEREQARCLDIFRNVFSGSLFRAPVSLCQDRHSRDSTLQLGLGPAGMDAVAVAVDPPLQ